MSCRVSARPLIRNECTAGRARDVVHGHALVKVTGRGIRSMNRVYHLIALRLGQDIYLRKIMPKYRSLHVCRKSLIATKA